MSLNYSGITKNRQVSRYLLFAFPNNLIMHWQPSEHNAPCPPHSHLTIPGLKPTFWLRRRHHDGSPLAVWNKSSASHREASGKGSESRIKFRFPSGGIRHYLSRGWGAEGSEGMNRKHTQRHRDTEARPWSVSAYWPRAVFRGSREAARPLPPCHGPLSVSSQTTCTCTGPTHFQIR